MQLESVPDQGVIEPEVNINNNDLNLNNYVNQENASPKEEKGEFKRPEHFAATPLSSSQTTPRPQIDSDDNSRRTPR